MIVIYACIFLTFLSASAVLSYFLFIRPFPDVTASAVCKSVFFSLGIGIVGTIAVLAISLRNSPVPTPTDTGLYIDAKCIKLRTKKTSGGKTIYIPIYEAIIAGAKIQIQGKNTETPPSIGQICKIKTRG